MQAVLDTARVGNWVTLLVGDADLTLTTLTMDYMLFDLAGNEICEEAVRARGPASMVQDDHPAVSDNDWEVVFDDDEDPGNLPSASWVSPRDLERME